jgi:sulfate adenylyltransferase subunit 2
MNQEKHIQLLEAEAIFILREVAAQFSNPTLLFSGGKDSTVLIHLALKAFYPNKPPFKILHIDTGHNFPEALHFRDKLVEQYGLNLIVRQVADTIIKRQLEDPQGKFPSRNALQSYTLMDAINELDIDACIGGGRRDEEKARAKERIFSIRDKSGAWQPEKQRPELWNIYNGRLHKGENIRAFPLSNWSELDVWHYIRSEKIGLPPLYFAHPRTCLLYRGSLIALSEYITVEQTDVLLTKNVRYRTVGDMTCTAAVLSDAKNIDEVIDEISRSLISERGETRIDDRSSDSAMEDRKMKGYF